MSASEVQVLNALKTGAFGFTDGQLADGRVLQQSAMECRCEQSCKWAISQLSGSMVLRKSIWRAAEILTMDVLSNIVLPAWTTVAGVAITAAGELLEQEARAFGLSGTVVLGNRGLVRVREDKKKQCVVAGMLVYQHPKVVSVIECRCSQTFHKTGDQEWPSWQKQYPIEARDPCIIKTDFAMTDAGTLQPGSFSWELR